MTTAKPTKGKDLDAFRAAHDKSFIVPDKIRKGLEALGDSWEYETDFVRRCGLSTVDFNSYRELFADFFVPVPGSSPKKVWAGTKAFAAKLRSKTA